MCQQSATSSRLLPDRDAQRRGQSSARCAASSTSTTSPAVIAHFPKPSDAPLLLTAKGSPTDRAESTCP
jgi:hypothetical protein